MKNTRDPRFYDDYWGDVVPNMTEAQSGNTPPHVNASSIINGQIGGLAMPKLVKKWWGHELHYKNDEQYCMKLLHFETGGHTSMHFHVGKHETLLVTNGVLTLEVMYNKETKVYRLPAGQAWVVCPGLPHRLVAAEGPVDLVEASTQDFDDDSVRLIA